MKRHDLSKKYFFATYRTRLLKYDGQVIPPINQGNVISHTCIFGAHDKKDAEHRAPALFNANNRAFNSLNRLKMVVEHELSKNKDNGDRFYSTEYTSLRKFERMKVKKLRQLNWLSSFESEFGEYFDRMREMNRGRYILYKYQNGSVIVFREDKSI